MSQAADSPRDRPPPTSRWRGERIAVHASEDDLVAFLAGATVRLPFQAPGQTVCWRDEAAEGLALSEIEQLRTDGLDQWVKDRSSDEGRRVVTIKVGAAQERPGVAESRARRLTVSEEAYRMLCGLVQRQEVLDPGRVDGSAWGELRRTFPAAQFVRAPSERVELNMIRAGGPTAAVWAARGVIADVLAANPEHVVLAPIREADGRYSVTMIVHTGR
jgi:hypothetical protein